MTKMTWFYENQPFTSEMIKEYQGFVYLITNLDTQKRYIGKKNFIKKRTLKALKGKKRRRKVYLESDWKEYYGSSDAVNKILLESGPEVFKREILHLCMSKGEMSYVELYYQVQTGALFSDEYYNGIISCRINHRHVKNLDIKTLKKI
jgi:hypothetical protein